MTKMKIEIFSREEQLDQRAAELIAEVVQTEAEPVLGLATGGTPVGTYKALIDLHKQKGFTFKHTRTANLDEYVGLPNDHSQSYMHYMKEHLFNHIDLPANQAYIPDGMAADLDAECRRYDDILASLGRIDLQILGIGHNGHIGFNEPSDSLNAGTHRVQLSEETIKANARFFNTMEEVPKQAITVGVGPIMKAKKLLLLAKGEGKADILYQALKGPITTQCPASLLQTHPNLYVLVDEAAGRKLQ